MRWSWLSFLALGGCYTSLGGGYVHRFAEHGGHGAEGHMLFTVGDGVHEDFVPMYAKVTVAGGSWGVRGAAVAGIAPSVEVGDDVWFFGRPGLAYVVIGHESPRGEDGTWVGIGLETDLGLRFRIGDRHALEVGVRGGGDISYTGDGSGAFVGAFVGVGWGSIFDDMF